MSHRQSPIATTRISEVMHTLRRFPILLGASVGLATLALLAVGLAMTSYPETGIAPDGTWVAGRLLDDPECSIIDIPPPRNILLPDIPIRLIPTSDRVTSELHQLNGGHVVVFGHFPNNWNGTTTLPVCIHPTETLEVSNSEVYYTDRVEINYNPPSAETIVLLLVNGFLAAVLAILLAKARMLS